MRYRYLWISLLVLSCVALSACSKCSSSIARGSQSIVVLSPEVAEILVAIGAEDRIIGVTEECTYPEVLASKTRVGKFGVLDREKIIGLKPDLIFASALEQQSVAEEFGKLGFHVETVYPKSIVEMLSEIRRIGLITGLDKAANELADSLYTAIEQIKAKSDGKPKPKVYLEIYRDPLMSVSDQSFVGELIAAAGGDNIFPTLERDYARVKAEDVVKAAPEIIICYSQDSLANIISRKGWQRVPAIRNKMVFFEEDINPDWIQRAGPRVILGLRRLNELFGSMHTAEKG